QYIKDLIITIFGEEFATKIKIVPAGVDLSSFNPTGYRKKSLQKFKRSVNKKILFNGHGFSQNAQGEMLEHINGSRELNMTIKRIHQGYDDRRPDLDLPKKLASLSVNDKIILFVGKLIVSKGVHLSIAAMPLVTGGTGRKIKLIVVGFGEQREALELLINAIASADLKSIHSIAKIIDDKLSGQTYLRSFFYRLQTSGMLKSYMKEAVDLRQNIIFTGLLGHGETRYLEQLADIQLVMSLLPEAFGLVVLEGAACGAIPIISNHSGLKDLADVIEAESHLNKGFISVNLNQERIVFDLGAKISRIIALPQAERLALGKRIAKVPLKKYSWKKTADNFIDLYWNHKKAA
ncbi:MAG TPA: glycosyltransferase, partial [Actinobacteria bacterium]|nr:glycosyltransferase [Actinomycetes bacterium]HEX21341.1 glycosyltransferase [Actinomycetota bacterium]